MFDYLLIIFGTISIVFYKKLARWYVKYQKEHFGIKLGKDALIFNQILSIAIGGLAVVIGILGIVGIFPDFE